MVNTIELEKESAIQLKEMTIQILDLIKLGLVMVAQVAEHLTAKQKDPGSRTSDFLFQGDALPPEQDPHQPVLHVRAVQRLLDRNRRHSGSLDQTLPNVQV